MTCNREQRFIYPFGDGNLTLDMDTYTLDCRQYVSQNALETAIHDQWHDKGLVVLVNTDMQHLSELERWSSIIYQDFNAYAGGAAPRSKWSDAVYAIDDTPPHIDMGYHNEGCYLSVIPRCFVIGSLACPQKDGWTLVSDNEATTDALLKTEIGQKMKEHGVRYVRNMTDKYAENAIVHKHWQDTFLTESRKDVEQYVRVEGWDHQWMPDGTLRTSYWADAFEYNEKLGKSLFFANLGNHGAFFDQWHPFNTLLDEERPHTMVLGDGTPFTDEDIATIYAINNKASLGLRWQEADVTLLDNERWSHARPAYALQSGETRVMGVTTGMLKERLGSRF